MASRPNKYVDGTNVTGQEAIDTVTMGGFTLPKFSFTEATGYQSFSTTGTNDADGIVGMSLPVTATSTSSSQTIHTPLFVAMINSNVVNVPQFSYYIAPDGSTGIATFGGYDTALFANQSAQVAWFPTIQTAAFTTRGTWAIPISSITTPTSTIYTFQGSSTTGTNQGAAYMDTGTSLGLLPTFILDKIGNMIPGASQQAIGSGYVYTVPCSVTTGPDLIFNMANGGVLVLTSAEYIISLGNNVCLIGFVASDVLGSQSLLLGNLFLKRFVSVFDYGTKRIGFILGKGRVGAPVVAGSLDTAGSSSGVVEAGILTQYLNDILTPDEISSNATSIWIDAFKQNWSGNLSLLPKQGFPNAFNGLCQVSSKEMYNRLCRLFPNLSPTSPKMNQILRVFFTDNSSYGRLLDAKGTVSINLDDQDQIEVRDHPISEFDQLFIRRGVSALSSCLIHIPMGRCWLDHPDLEPWVSLNPGNMVKMGIAMNHFDLYGNLEMFKYIWEKGCRFGQDYFFTNTLVEAVQHSRISILDFIVNNVMFAENTNGVQYIAIFNQRRYTENLRLWEWWIDICQVHSDKGLQPNLQLVVKTLAEAKHVVAKLGPRNNIDFQMLEVSAQQGNLESFNYLWKHCRNVPQSISQLSTTQALADTINLSYFQPRETLDFDGHEVILPCFTIEALIFKHVNDGTPRCASLTIARNLIKHQPFPYIQTFLRVCKCPYFEFIFSLMDFAAKYGKLEVLQYLHENNISTCTTEAMDLASENGHLSVVEYLHENRSEGCTTEAMDAAARNGHLEVVKFLHYNRNEGCTKAAMTDAAREGHVDVVRFLNENRNEGHYKCIVWDAIRFQRFEVVKYLHESVATACEWFGTKAMDLAAFNGDLRIVRYLYLNRPWEGFSFDGLLECASQSDDRMRGANLRVVEFLLKMKEFRDIIDFEELYGRFDDYDARIRVYLVGNINEI
ncbi:hypothetical protein HDU76_002964, partial [Blyttiomyces sp. JEL0837]